MPEPRDWHGLVRGSLRGMEQVARGWLEGSSADVWPEGPQLVPKMTGQPFCLPLHCECISRSRVFCPCLHGCLLKQKRKLRSLFLGERQGVGLGCLFLFLLTLKQTTFNCCPDPCSGVRQSRWHGAGASRARPRPAPPRKRPVWEPSGRSAAAV